MKKITLLIILTSCFCTCLKAQNKPDTSKPKYNYFVRVPINDYTQIANSLTEYKRLQMYDPMSPSDAKVKLFQGIEAYLKELPSRLKLDSVKIITPKTK